MTTTIVELENRIRENLNTYSPWNFELEFDQKNLKKLLLQSLFNDYDNVLENVNTLWLNTTQNFIKCYRVKITILKNSKNRNNYNDKRKLFEQFLKFLNFEINFYRDLLKRILTKFNLSDWEWLLADLNNIVNDYNINHSSNDVRSDLLDLDYSHSINDDNNDNIDVHLLQLSVYKILIYFGDLFRYYELYNQSRDHIRNFNKVLNIYTLAFKFDPSQGQHFNQISVINSYEGDLLSEVYHYFRSLSSKSPFMTSLNNLKGLFKKHLSTSNDHNDDFDRFMSLYLNLLGMLFLNKNSKLDLNDNLNECLQLFKKLLSFNKFSSDQLLKMNVINFSLYYHSKTYRDTDIDHIKSQNKMLLNNDSRKIFIHKFTLKFISCVLESVNESFGENNEDDDESNEDIKLASNLTTNLKRCIDSLRLFSFFLKSNENFHIKELKRSKSNTIPLFWKTLNESLIIFSRKFSNGTDENDNIHSFENDKEFIYYSPFKHFNFISISNNDNNNNHPNIELIEKVHDFIHVINLIKNSLPFTSNDNSQ